MARVTFIISVFTFLLCIGKSQAQSFWRLLENENGLCEVDSLVVVNKQYYSLLDTIEQYWTECEFDKNPCYAVIYFSDTNCFRVSVQQMVEIWSLVIKCYQKKIYGAFYYQNHPYFVLAADTSLIAQNFLQKSTKTFTPVFFSTQTYDSLTLTSNYLIRKEKIEPGFIYPPTPFDHEWEEDQYDKLELELIIAENNIICIELDGCMLYESDEKND